MVDAETIGCRDPGKIAVDSWKGCERGYHDYDTNGNVVEIKTTLSKEPRKVQISNERQLDERGLISLHLLVLTLVQAQMGGESLPVIIAILRRSLLGDVSSLRRFEHSLHEAGYLEIHAHLYDATYTVRNEDFFKVKEGFPRITEVPQGLGDLKYSLLIGACVSHTADINKYINMLKGQIYDK